ncbi:hypothetical protein D3C87_2056280 [compost metagenome]
MAESASEKNRSVMARSTVNTVGIFERSSSVNTRSGSLTTRSRRRSVSAPSVRSATVFSLLTMKDNSTSPRPL